MAVLKRAIDLGVALTLLVLLSPLLLLVAVAVQVTMGGPVLFSQERAGRGGAPFSLLKFRSMRDPRPGEESPEFDMVRMTRLGRLLRRTSIDELPSLLNVVRGDMSLVGPRPLPLSYTERYSLEQRRRLEVLPGLTGWAVVHGRNRLGWDERLALDCWYVDHRSILLDLRILVLTVRTLVRAQEVNHSDDVTMTEFRGDTSA